MLTHIRKMLICLVLFGTMQAKAQTTLDVETLRNSPQANAIIDQKRTELKNLLGQIRSNVNALIANQGIQNSGTVLSFENLASAVNTANVLESMDSLYTEAHAKARSEIITYLWDAQICTRGMSQEAYTEDLRDYLDEQGLPDPDNAGGEAFAVALNFESALVKLNREFDAWLEVQGDQFDDLDPTLNQEISNELYWSILSPTWDIELRNPEPELARKMEGGKFSFKSILKFIFENWDKIKDILDWLNDNVFYDCHATASAKERAKDFYIPQYLSPERSRRVQYVVGQKGVAFDFKSTKTKIEGKVKLYKKKQNKDKWKKDKDTFIGIGFCAREYDECNKRRWPIDGIERFRPRAHLYKTKWKQQHPYALSLLHQDDFLTFPVFYQEDRKVAGYIPLLGPENETCGE